MSESGKKFLGFVTDDQFQGICFSVVAIMFVIGLIVPDDVLAKFPSIIPIVDCVANVVPMINKIAALGMQVERNKFLFALNWLVITPFGFVMVLFAEWRVRVGIYQASIVKVAYVTLMLALMSWLIWEHGVIAWGVSGEYAMVQRKTFGTIVGVALSAPMYVMAFYVGLGGVMAMLKCHVLSNAIKLFKSKEGR